MTSSQAGPGHGPDHGGGQSAVLYLCTAADGSIFRYETALPVLRRSGGLRRQPLPPTAAAFAFESNYTTLAP